MSSVFNESPLKSQAKSKFLSDYVTGGNVTVYWLIFIYTMNYEINNPQGRLIQILTWIKLRFSLYMGHVSTCAYYYIVCHLQSALSTGWQMACLFPSLQCLFQTWLWQHVKPTWWSSMTQQFSCAPCPRARPCLMFGWKAALWSQQVEECSSAMEAPPSLLPWWPAMTRGRLSAMCPTVSAMKSAPLYIWTSAVSFHKTMYQPTALTKSSHTTS